MTAQIEDQTAPRLVPRVVAADDDLYRSRDQRLGGETGPAPNLCNDCETLLIDLLAIVQLVSTFPPRKRYYFAAQAIVWQNCAVRCCRRRVVEKQTPERGFKYAVDNKAKHVPCANVIGVNLACEISRFASLGMKRSKEGTK